MPKMLTKQLLSAVGVQTGMLLGTVLPGQLLVGTRVHCENGWDAGQGRGQLPGAAGICDDALGNGSCARLVILSFPRNLSQHPCIVLSALGNVRIVTHQE